MADSPMTPRERVAAALDHREPDKVPLALGGSAQHMSEQRFELLRKHFELDPPERRTLVGFYTTPDYNPVLDKLGTDIRYLHLRPPENYISNSMLKTDEFEVFTDEWGLTHKLRSGYYELAGTPLADNFSRQGIDQFDWPDPYDPIRVEGLKEEAHRLHTQTDYALALHRPIYGNFWEMAKFMVGMEKALMASALEPELLQYLFEKLAEVQYGFYDAALDEVGEYVQFTEMAEDLGTNVGPIFSPDFYRKHLLPVHTKFIKALKDKTPHLKILLHNDGAIREFIPDIIEAGFDLLNPIESHLPGMDPAGLKEDFGDRLVFQGGVNVKEILPKGTEEEIRAEVRLRIEQMGPGGGYILGPTHNLGNDIPLENILIFFRAGHDLGHYPL